MQSHLVSLAKQHRPSLPIDFIEVRCDLVYMPGADKSVTKAAPAPRKRTDFLFDSEKSAPIRHIARLI